MVGGGLSSAFNGCSALVLSLKQMMRSPLDLSSTTIYRCLVGNTLKARQTITLNLRSKQLSIERDQTESNGVMTTAPSTSLVHSTRNKAAFVEVIESRLLKQQESFLVLNWEEKHVFALGVRFHLANDLGPAASLPLFTCPGSPQFDSCASFIPQHCQPSIPQMGYSLSHKETRSRCTLTALRPRCYSTLLVIPLKTVGWSLHIDR